MAAYAKPKRSVFSADRREAIVEAAAEIFLERGYAGATTDRLIERIGGSKETVYSHFGNKAGLFEAVMARNSAILVEEVTALDPNRPVAETLASFGRTYLTVILTPQKLAMFRLAAAESARSPELGAAFWRAGPSKVTERMAHYFATLAERGLVTAADPHWEATTFLATLRGELHLQALLDPGFVTDAPAISRHVGACVEALLGRIGAAKA
jgi:AcrR family transcriptional regulator